MNRNSFEKEVLALVDEKPQEDIDTRHLIATYTGECERPEQVDNRHKIMGVLSDLKQAGEIEYIEDHWRNLTTLSAYNFIMDNLKIRSTRKRANQQEAKYMTKNYRFEILKILYEKKFEMVNLRPYIMNWINTDDVTRQHISHTLYQLKDKGGFVRFQDISSLSVSQNGVYPDQMPINAALEYTGEDEYLRLERQSNPQPTIKQEIFVGGNAEGSTLGYHSLSNSSISSAKHNSNIPKAKTPIMRSLKLIGLILGILGSLALLWEFVLRHFFSSPSIVP